AFVQASRPAPLASPSTSVSIVDRESCANGGSSFCCSQVHTPDATATGVLAGLLDNIHVGFDCVPVGVQILATGTADQCQANVVCCNGKNHGAGIQMG
ncbi:hypothetical protein CAUPRSCDRAFT_3125, partial [Caulochytrium protostelioides]